MKRMHTGFESADLTWMDSTVTGTNWTIANTAGSALSGSRGVAIVKASAAGPTVGAYAIFNPVSGIPVYWPAVGVDGSEVLLDKGVGEAKVCWARFYFKIVAHPPSGTNAYSILGMILNGAVRGPAIAIDNSSRRLQLYNNGSAVKQLLASATLGVRYRLELVATTDLNGDGIMAAFVYVGDAVVPLASAYSTYTLGTGTIQSIRFGVDTIFNTGTGAAEYHMDDCSVNDNLFDGVYQLGVHNGSPFVGACVGLVVPTAAGGSAEWTTGPVPALTNYQMVDEWPPDDDTTYCTTLTAGTVDRRDSHAFPNLGAVGYKVKSIAMMCRHADSGGGFPGHRAGIVDSGTDLENNIDVTGGSYTYRIIVVGEKAGGGPWTNAAYDAAEMMYRRDSGASVLSSRRVSAVNLEAETDAGVTHPADIWQPPHNQVITPFSGLISAGYRT